MLKHSVDVMLGGTACIVHAYANWFQKTGQFLKVYIITERHAHIIVIFSVLVST